MATKKQGVLTTPKFNSCCKHLRPYGKRQFWRIERRAAKRMLRLEAS